MTITPIPVNPDRVLVTVDRTPRSHDAVPVAVATGQRIGAAVNVLVRAGRDRSRHDAVLRSVLAANPALEALDEESATADPSALLVKGCPSDREPWGGSTSRRPWIAVGPNLRPVAQRRFETLVVPLDGTPELDELIAPALAWARAHELRVRVTAVVPDAPPPLRRPRDPTPRQRFETDPRRHVDGVLRCTDTSRIDVIPEVVREPLGLSAAFERRLRHTPEAALLMPASRPTSIRSTLKRSSTRAVLRTCPVPVLLVPGVEPAGRAT